MLEINYNTELRHFSYPSINQFRNVIRNVQHTARYRGQGEDGEPIYDTLAPLPIIKAVGTTKLHGTNAAIVFDFENNVVYFQSRENIITPLKDNAGFAGYMASIQDKLVDICAVNSNIDDYKAMGINQIIVYGEWCGGNIQKGVAISGLDKMFVAFDVRIISNEDGEEVSRYTPALPVTQFLDHDLKIYNIYEFPTWEVDIDFNRPELAQEQLSKITLEIEKQCPVGKFFEKDGIGEGAVWKLVSDDPKFQNNSGFWMKVKGEKHSSSKVKTLAAVDVEKINSIREFVESVVTDSRCKQSIQKLKEAGVTDITRQHLGEFIRWIHNDVVKEELDTIAANGFEVKELGSPIATAARGWFFKNENDL